MNVYTVEVPCIGFVVFVSPGQIRLVPEVMAGEFTTATLQAAIDCAIYSGAREIVIKRIKGT